MNPHRPLLASTRHWASLRVFVALFAGAMLPLASISAAEVKAHPDLPKGYEMPERALSPEKRFAVLFPEHKEETPKGDYPPNLLVRLEPFQVLAKVCEPGLPENVTTSLEVQWQGDSLAAIYEFRKWGILDLRVYELEEGKLKRVHPVWKEARKLFEKDIRARLLKKYPREAPTFFFVSEEGEENPRQDFRFEGRRLRLDMIADNKPNGAGGPHWSARLVATWNLDTARLENVDLRPGKVSVRPSL